MKKNNLNKINISKSRFSFWLIIVLGLISLVLFFSNNITWEKFVETNIPLHDNLKQGHINYHLAYLLYERKISNNTTYDKSVSIEEILKLLDKSLFYVNNCLLSKSNFFNIKFLPIKDPTLIKQINELKTSLVQIKIFLLKIKNNKEKQEKIYSIHGNALFYNFKKSFKNIHNKFSKIENIVDTNIANMLPKIRMFSNISLMLWIFFLASFSLIVFIKDKKKYQLDLKLNQASLEHEETNQNLEKIVNKRTKDLTDANENLKYEKEFAESLIDTAQTIILILDTQGKIVRFNKFMEKISGYKLDEVKGKDWFTTFLPNCDYDKIRELFKKAVANIQTSGNVNPIIVKDGRSILIEWYDKTLKDHNGNCIELLAIGYDITERKENEKQAIKLKTAIEQIDENILILDIDGKIDYINPAFCKTSGFKYNEIIGKEFNKFLYSDDPNFTFNELWKIVTKGKVWKGILLSKKANEDIYKDATIVSPIYNDLKEIINYVVVKRDVTHDAKLEKRLRESQKIEAIGTLAGGIAHDFNNLLFGIMTYSELGQKKSSNDTKIQSYFTEILQACHRAKDLTSQILTFSRKQEEELKPIKLIPLLKETIKFVRSTIPTSIEFITDINTNHDLILGSAIQIHQIIVNLFTNASHAIGEKKGTIKISLKNINLDYDFTSLYDLEPGKYLNLIIEDTGCGITPENLERIFDPFFTTKPVDKGTGMGLSVVYGIIQNHKAIIKVSSELNKRTIFSLFFPITKQKSKIEDKPIELNEDGSENILLVDDEKIICDSLKKVLVGFGYNITNTTESSKAYDYFLSDPKSFDLLITDQTMPKLTGIELIAKFNEIRPDLPAILMTGFSDSNIFEKVKNMGHKYLQKPVSISLLLKTIREALDKDIDN